MEPYCKACIKCEVGWSAGRGNSCHDNCKEFLKWKAEHKTEKPKRQITKTHIPGGF